MTNTKIPEIKSRMQRGTTEYVILSVVKAAGLLTLALLAPNAVQMLVKLGFIKKSTQSPFYTKTILGNLKDEGLLEFVGKGGEKKLKLTARGEQKLSRYQLRYHKRPDRKWDGKWRVIIFDIKESRREDRNDFRDQLIAQGFVRLQQSVWVHPHDCEEFIALVKTAYGLGPSVLYMIVERIENDTKLRKAFGLPNE